MRGIVYFGEVYAEKAALNEDMEAAADVYKYSPKRLSIIRDAVDFTNATSVAADENIGFKRIYWLTANGTKMITNYLSLPLRLSK